ncbi:MAG: hypothetical protein K2I25_01370, partial [Muribaculaceae bacterium]|nr:hypothetical protein [Muribaculaceae bacterium]
MKIKSLILTAAFTATAFAASGETRLEQGRWAIVNADDNTLDISFDGKEAILDAYAEATYRIAGTSASGHINLSLINIRRCLRSYAS